MKTKSVGERIRNLRKSKKMSQEVGRKTKCFSTFYFKLGKGCQFSRHTCIIEMTELFGVSLNHLVKGDELIVNKYVYAALAFFLGLGHTDFIESNMVKHYYIYYFVGQVFLVLLE